MSSIARILLAAAVVVCLVEAAVARQGTPPSAQPQDPLQALRAKDTFNDADRDALQKWLNDRFAVIQGDDHVAAGKAVQELAAANTGGSAFMRAFADACIQSVGKSYKNVEIIPALQLLAALNLINDVEAYAVFIEALSDERTGVRYTAAAGLRNLRARLSVAGGKYVNEPLASLREAGLRETSKLTLRAIYKALNFRDLPNPPEIKANAEALLTLLSSRAEQYMAGRVRAYGADDLGLRVAGTFSAADMTPEQRKQFIIIVGKMLRYTVRLYTTAAKTDDGVMLPPATARQDTELLIREAERQLKALLSPPAGKAPGITTWMQKVDQFRMKIEFNKWGELVKQATDFEIFQDGDASSQPSGGG